jgi:hypothetical protein
MWTQAMPKAAKPWSLTSLREKRQGGQPWPLRDIPDGRGRGVATDVRVYPAHHPVAGPTRAGVRGDGVRCERR